jgi:hypothetical protein
MSPRTAPAPSATAPSASTITLAPAPAPTAERFVVTLRRVCLDHGGCRGGAECCLSVDASGPSMGTGSRHHARRP